MNKDLTVGDPAKVLWKFCLPLFGSIIFQQLYNIAFAFGCNIGCSVIVSQLFGAKKLGEMKTAV